MDHALQRYLHTVLAVVVVYITMIVTAAASPVNFVSAGKISVFFVTSASPTRKIAADTCKSKGGILLADYAPAVQQMYMEPFVERGATYLCQSTGYGWSRNCYGAYTEGQATEGPCTLARREKVFSLAFDPATEAKMCPYRWSLGWFGRYTNNLGQVGVNFYDSSWADLAFDGSDPSQIPTESELRNYERMVSDTSTLNIYAGGPANDYDDGVMWNASFQCYTKPDSTTMAACIPPHGNPYVALGARQLSGASGGYYGVRVDAPETPTATATGTLNTPFVPNNYVVACQWQGVEASYYASTTLPPQPPMVPDWKQPTWIQSHWWIIFLVFAVVLLALLVAFIVWYECQLCAAKWDDDDTEMTDGVKSNLIAPPETSTELNPPPAQATKASTTVTTPAQAPDASEPSVFPPPQQATQQAMQPPMQQPMQQQTQQQTQQPMQQPMQQQTQQPMQQQTQQPMQQQMQQPMQQPMQQQTHQQTQQPTQQPMQQPMQQQMQQRTQQATQHALPEHSEDSPIPLGIGDLPTFRSSRELETLTREDEALPKQDAETLAEETKKREEEDAERRERLASVFDQQAVLDNPPADPRDEGNTTAAVVKQNGRWIKNGDGTKKRRSCWPSCGSKNTQAVANKAPARLNKASAVANKAPDVANEAPGVANKAPARPNNASAVANNPLAEAEMPPVTRSAPNAVQTSATGATPARGQTGDTEQASTEQQIPNALNPRSQLPGTTAQSANGMPAASTNNVDDNVAENRQAGDVPPPHSIPKNGGPWPWMSIPDAIDVQTVSSMASDDSVQRRVRLGGRPRFTTTQAATKTAVPGAPDRQRSPIQARNGGRAGPPAPATAHIASPQGTGGQGQPAQGARAAPVQIPAALPLPAANAASVRAPVPAVQAAQGTRAPAAQSQAPAAQPAQGTRPAANPANNQVLNSPSDEMYPGVWDSPVWDGYGSIHKPNNGDM